MNLAYQDLTTTCTAIGCDEGTVYSPKWAAWCERVKAARDEWEAANSGRAAGWHTSAACRALETKRPSGPEEYDCITCCGTGFVPNQTGEAILKLIREYGGR